MPFIEKSQEQSRVNNSSGFSEELYTELNFPQNNFG
jgi:hypothetical protein